MCLTSILSAKIQSLFLSCFQWGWWIYDMVPLHEMSWVRRGSRNFSFPRTVEASVPWSLGSSPRYQTKRWAAENGPGRKAERAAYPDQGEQLGGRPGTLSGPKSWAQDEVKVVSFPHQAQQPASCLTSIQLWRSGQHPSRQSLLFVAMWHLYRKEGSGGSATLHLFLPSQYYLAVLAQDQPAQWEELRE